MPNIKSAKKRVRITAKKTERNYAIRSFVKNRIKNYETALLNNDKELAQTELTNAVKAIDSAVSKGVLHKNTAARKKSRLAKKFNNIA
ncbi:30S ribosomal protein S20 [Proteinivorax hydrogeniformans]|uniref:Small ribosomal subunit protein bS20 n=1 Tax=Proteinivorax hydrogeniformans TaxID=1826727 RepID=A0AAU8HWL3_9FIRM